MTGAGPMVSTLLRAWGSRLGAETRCDPWSDLHFVFRVAARRADGTEQVYFLKDAGPANPQGGPNRLASDIAVLRHLKTCGLPVALPEPTDDGQPFLQHGGKCYTLTPELPNAPSETAPNNRVYRNIGAAVARLHNALASYPDPIDSWTMDLPPRILEEALPVILRHQDAWQNEQLIEVLETIRGPIERLSDLPSQHIHGDCHGGNILLAGDAVSGFVDLDHLPTGPRVYDLCCYLANDAVHYYKDPASSKAWIETAVQNLFAGYEQVNPLSGAEKDAVPYLILGFLLIKSAWFYEPLGLPDRAQEDMQLFYWMYANLNLVCASI